MLDARGQQIRDAPDAERGMLGNRPHVEYSRKDAMENASSSVIEARPSTGMPQEEAPRVEAARRPGASRQAIASAQVFLGGACHGAMATTYKLAYAAGFTSSQVVAGQAWLALSFFAIAVLLGMMRGRRIVRLGAAQTLKLMGLGVLTCTTSILYCYAMSVLPAPVALTLLFQFTWIGLVIQMISTRRAPRACEIAAAAIILLGTVFASGLYSTGLDSLDPTGIACALGAAVTCALFITLSGKVQAPCTSAQRGLMVMVGGAALSLVACPDFFHRACCCRALHPMLPLLDSSACSVLSSFLAWAHRISHRGFLPSWRPPSYPWGCSFL